MAYELTCCCSGRSNAKTIYYIVETALEEEDEVLTLLSAKAASPYVCVVELTLENTIHILNFLLLFKLIAVFF